MRATWTQLKPFVLTGAYPLLYVERGDSYEIDCGPYHCQIVKDAGADQVEFEADFKDDANVPARAEVVTQFEKNDKDLKVASGKGAFDGTTKLAVVEIPSPAGSSGRFIESGLAFVDDPHAGDKITKIEAIDTPAGTYSGVPGYVLKTYHDDDQAEDNQGWWLPPKANGVSLDTMAGYGFVPPGVTLKVTFKSAKADPTGDFARVNIKWGRLSV